MKVLMFTFIFLFVFVLQGYVASFVFWYHFQESLEVQFAQKAGEVDFLLLLVHCLFLLCTYSYRLTDKGS
jgi:hypothetical protein